MGLAHPSLIPATSNCFYHRHISLKVPKVEFDFDVSVWHCLLSTHTSKSKSILGTHLHAMIRTHHFDFDIRF